MTVTEFAVAALVVSALFTVLAFVSDYLVPALVRFHRRGMARVRRAS